MRMLAPLCLLVVTLGAPALRADEVKDPLRFVPAVADVVIKMERPRALLDAITHHEVVQQALKIAAVREFYDSTNYRRLQQLIAHFEKELGKDKEELLDALTGGGVVFAATLEKPSPVMVIVQAKDEKLLHRFVERAAHFLQQELARQEAKLKLERKMVDGFEVYALDKARLMVIDGALILTNQDNVLKHIMNVKQGKEKLEPITASPRFSAERKSIPQNAHLWGWLNFEAVKKLPGYKAGFEAGAQDPFLTFIFGGVYDVIRRTPSVTGYVAQDGPNWHARVQLGAGRDGMGGVSRLVTPEDGKGSLPLLKTPRTFASVSYFMDLGEMWQHRHKIFNDKQVAELEKGEKASAKFLGSARLEKLLLQAGNHHRVVFAQPESSPYKTKPTTPIPAFGLVIDMRDPQFAKSMNFILRGAALFGTFAVQSGLKMIEEEHAGHTLVSYYFREDKKFDGDPSGVRFNFSPCFTTVGDQFVMSSTVELGRDLIDALVKPSREPASPATMRTALYAEGVVHTIKASEEQVLTQTILSQALPPGEAGKEIERVLALVNRLGSVHTELHYEPSALRFDLRWRVK